MRNGSTKTAKPVEKIKGDSCQANKQYLFIERLMQTEDAKLRGREIKGDSCQAMTVRSRPEHRQAIFLD